MNLIFGSVRSRAYEVIKVRLIWDMKINMMKLLFHNIIECCGVVLNPQFVQGNANSFLAHIHIFFPSK